MKHIFLKNKIIVLLILILTFFTQFALHTTAQENTGTVSGRVVDIDEHPVPKLAIFIAPLEIAGGWTSTVFLPDDYSLLHRAQTDGSGQFSITGIPQGSFYFGVLPYNIDKRLPHDFEKTLEYTQSKDFAELNGDYIDAFISNNFGMQKSDFKPDVDILSLSVKGITFYPLGDSDEIGFGIEPGTHIEDVEVIVKPRMRVRGHVLFKDGTPLANARLKMRVKFRREDGSGSSGGSPWIDAEGYFVMYLRERNKAASYTFSVEYQGLEATAEPVWLEPGDRLDGLKLIFDSDPIPPKPLPLKTKKEIEKFESSSTPKATQKPESNEVWIVNPTNGHAYKRVHCKTRDDAIAQAIKEKAHLVTINDAAEQKWLAAVFGNEFYWIGLSDAKKEGQWQWHNGEPLTYKNWLSNDYFSESFDANERDYAVITFINGKWYAVSPKSVIVQMTEMAIIEKADVKIKQPAKKK